MYSINANAKKPYIKIVAVYIIFDKKTALGSAMENHITNKCVFYQILEFAGKRYDL